ncbi:hypothetical protein LCM20_09885 [Halobacillus litoralis]|uniref:hypothetical protein n=1 Tax=Halobacillus litoralis TaxID=45668 RepID=UPI001CD3FA3C|nr:hypothetical protein [Halobacillus litoralis]MCA0970900.1 hypothetical protein [Halobacillus litoralis]
MEQHERRKLRTKQILFLNFLIFSIIGAALLLLYYTTDTVFYSVFALLLLTISISEWQKFRTGRYAWTPDMRKLILYEKDVMDDPSFEKERKSKFKTPLLLSLVVLVIAFSSNNEPMIFDEALLWIVVCTVVPVIILLNIGIVRRARKVDNGNGYFQEIQKIHWTGALVYFSYTIVLSLMLVLI